MGGTLLPLSVDVLVIEVKVSVTVVVILDIAALGLLLSRRVLDVLPVLL